jgi:hypothetical protein
VFIIGIDPHKGSHTAAVLDRTETVIGELRVCADRRQRDQLLGFAASFTPARGPSSRHLAWARCWHNTGLRW